jgi:hypothetical protein
MRLSGAMQAWSLWVVLFACAQLPVTLVRADPDDAQQADARESDGYRQLIDDAVKEFGAQNYLEARSLFLRAHALYPNSRTHRGIGVAQFELRQYVDCVQQLEAALASSVKPLTAEMRAETERLLARARAFVGQIDLSIKPERAQVRLDGNELAPEASRRLVLTLGEHTLQVAAPGFAPEQRKLNVQGGEHTRLTILLVDPTEPPAPAAPAKVERHWYRSPWLWVGVGVVVAGAAAGAGYALTREDEVAPTYGGTLQMVLKGP